MEVLYRRCAGLDVHKDTVVACARLVDGDSARASMETKTFGTTTRALLELSDWMAEREITHVVMESTDIYWKPVWHILEGNFELILGNAVYLRNVPGRKSDVADAAWLTDLLAHGLVRASFVPVAEQAEIRDLTRTRKQCVREQSRQVQRLQKVLEDCNIKLDSVISDITGTSGRAMVQALIDGETDPQKLAGLAHSRLKATPETLTEALRGKVTLHHWFMLKLHLDHYDAICKQIEDIDARIEATMLPFAEAAQRLQGIPGIGAVAASAVLAEIGVDMSRFPSAGHLLSWAGLVPQMDQSAGKHRNTRTRKGNPALKTMLVQCAWSASRAKKSYYRARFHRIRARRGVKKAVAAVAASLLTAAYYMLRDGTEHNDLGVDYFDNRDETKTVKRLERRIRELGYEVQIQKAG